MTSRLEKFQPKKYAAPLKILNDGNSTLADAKKQVDQNLSEIARRTGGQPSPAAQRTASRTDELRFQTKRKRRAKQEPKQEPENSTSELWKLHRAIQGLLRPPVAEDGTRERGPSVCGCGYASTANDDVTVRVRRTGSRPKASISGIFRCGSPWLCPICSKRTAVQRQARVQKVVEAILEKGGVFPHVVVTVRHKLGQKLADLKQAVSDSSRAARSGRAWKAIQADTQALGVLSAPEVTYSTHNGWHFHIHQAIPMLTSSTDVALKGCEQFIERYLKELAKRGFDATWNGQHISISRDPQTAAAYIGKGLSWEIAGGSGTKSKPRLVGGLTPFDIARRAADGNEEMRALWLEYAEAMAGTRSCVITAQIAKQLDIQADEAMPSEDETSSEETESVDVVGTIPTTNWNALLRLGHVPQLVQKLESQEAATWPAIRAWAIDVSTELRAKDIPCDSAPAAAPLSPTPTRSDLARTIAWRGLEYMSGRRFIENQVSRMKIDWHKFGGAEPPNISDVVGCLVKISRESKPADTATNLAGP